MAAKLPSTTFSDLSPAARVLWAKSGEIHGHGLLAHLLDVAAVAERIVAREPPSSCGLMAEGLGLTVEELPRWVAVLAGLHDLGKAIPGFQAKWPAGRAQDEAQGLVFSPAIILQVDQHARATAALLSDLLCEATGSAQSWCEHVTRAVSAHHGYHFTSSEIDEASPHRKEPAAWEQARTDLLASYWAVLAPPGRPTRQVCNLPIVNWLAGLTSVADWIASNPKWFPLGERVDDLAAYHHDALRLADLALPHLGWHRWRPLLSEPASVEALLSDIMGKPGVVPRPLQIAADQMLAQASGPSLLLVEAPMGEGKTELAFLAHLRLQSANAHRGLYLALPTQATGNALFSRAKRFLEAFASGPVDVQLVHGGAAMNDELAALRGLGEIQGVGDEPLDTLSANAWFGQRSRPLLSPYGVGTVDQALFAVLNVKHHFVRLWGLGNRVVVLDEVHAYGTYTSGLIDVLLRWLKALRCSVVLMSATLPRRRRQQLLQAWGCSAAQVDVAYPRLLLADEHQVRGSHVAARSLAPIKLQPLSSNVSDLAACAIAQLDGGGCGALIVNTVSRAQQLYQRLQQALAERGWQDVAVLLFHARFPADDRQVLEAQVLARFGAQGQRPLRALLVATQVAEQSLDIDFDFMLTDLAPVDLLLQRAGRLHRHADRRRPAAHGQATLWVAGLHPQTLPDFKGTAWGFVYSPYILGRTWALLSRESLLHLPQDIDRLVQAVYDGDHELPENLDAAARHFIEVTAFGEACAETKASALRAANIVIDPDAPLSIYDGKPRGHEADELGQGLSNRTRLGEESVTLVPVHVSADGHWCVQPGEPCFDPNQLLTPVLARRLYARQVKLGRKGVVQRCLSVPPPRAFESHALLNNMRPLLLHDGRSVDERLKLTLDPVLGLIYGEISPENPLQEDTA